MGLGFGLVGRSDVGVGRMFVVLSLLRGSVCGVLRCYVGFACLFMCFRFPLWEALFVVGVVVANNLVGGVIIFLYIGVNIQAGFLCHCYDTKVLVRVCG